MNVSTEVSSFIFSPNPQLVRSIVFTWSLFEIESAQGGIFGKIRTRQILTLPPNHKGGVSLIKHCFMVL